jgi:hypothetical protein
VNTVSGCAFTKDLDNDAARVETMSENRTAEANRSWGKADDARLRYHLTSLYALRPIPDDLLQLVIKLGARLETEP